MRISFLMAAAGMDGGTRVVASHAYFLAKMGHEVHVFSCPRPPVGWLTKTKSWLRGDGWPPGSIRPSHLDDIGVNHHIIESWRPITNSDLPDADVVIATWWMTAEWVAALNKAKGVKVYFVQGHEIYPHIPEERTRATYRLPLHKIVVSRELQQLMSEQYGDHHSDLVSNTVDRQLFFADPRGKQQVPTVGLRYATDTDRALDLTLGALREITARFPRVRVLSFGTEPLKRKFCLPGEFTYIFQPSQRQIREIYSRCDVWLSGSKAEGFNLPVLEAMACRTPAVSTRTGWPLEGVISGWNGELVPVGDKAALAAALMRVLEQTDSAWREMSSNAYMTACNAGSWERQARLFEGAIMRARDRNLG